jgi:pimeloyl-ACP methyl ester carboxylesterase
MATFVVVHGAWSGAHAWRWVRPLLRAAGHEVFTPALTGLGERAHLADPRTDLDTHIQDVAAVLHYEDLRDVVLVGHSYGGMVVTGVADRVGHRLAQVVHLDADVPLDGQSEFDLLPPEEAAGYERAARARGDGWLVPPPFPDPLPPGTPAVVAWAVERMVPHPLRTLTQPLRLAHPEGAGLPRTYVHCTEGTEGQPVPAYVERVSGDPDWRVITLHAGHSAHVTAPDAVAGTLVEVART